MLERRGRRRVSLKLNNTQRMHVLPPRRVPAGKSETTAQESEEGNTTRPAIRPLGLPGTEKHVLPLCRTLKLVMEACYSEMEEKI